MLHRGVAQHALGSFTKMVQERLISNLLGSGGESFRDCVSNCNPKPIYLSQSGSPVIKSECQGFSLKKTIHTLVSFILKGKHSNMSNIFATTVTGCPTQTLQASEYTKKPLNGKNNKINMSFLYQNETKII